MANRLEYDSIFTPDGRAKIDQEISSTFDFQNNSTTFELTQASPSGSDYKPKLKEKESRQTFALTIEECKPTRDYHVGDCIPLPSNVSFERVSSHVIDSFKNAFHVQKRQKMNEIKKGFQQRKLGASYVFLGQGKGIKHEVNKNVTTLLDDKEDKVAQRLGDEEDKENKKLDKKMKAWQRYLSLPENEFIISDSFWYMRYNLISDPNGDEIREYLLNRMLKNYVNFFINVEGPYKNSFFNTRKEYFDIVSQSVYYALFYACPKSRDQLADETKEQLLLEFSAIFAGIKVSNPKKYYSNWYLDLGAGNILKLDESSSVKQRKLELPPINFKDNIVDLKSIKTLQDLGCSPIMGKYLANEKYKTRNQVKGMKMLFTELDYNPEEVEAKFEKCRDIAKDISNKMRMLRIQEKKEERDLKAELRKMKEENWRHQRRLSRRRNEELANGAHEYANYLVSILGTH